MHKQECHTYYFQKQELHTGEEAHLKGESKGKALASSRGSSKIPYGNSDRLQPILEREKEIQHG